MISPVAKERIFHVLSRAGIMGLLSPVDTASGRAASAATGALWGAMAARNISPDNIKALHNMKNTQVAKDMLMVGALGAGAAGLGAYANKEDIPRAAASKAAYLAGTEGLIHGLRKVVKL